MGKWNRQPPVLQLEHKNGIYNDNRLENLDWLCPNCHSQSSTFAGRNARKYKEVKNKVSKWRLHKRKVDHELVLKRLAEINNYVKVGREFGITDNGVRRIQELRKKELDEDLYFIARNAKWSSGFPLKEMLRCSSHLRATKLSMNGNVNRNQEDLRNT